MISKEDGRRLAQLERQLRREDPEFHRRMSAGAVRRRAGVPWVLVAATVVAWSVALVLAVTGWWVAAGVAALWAAVTAGALGYRFRATRPARRPQNLPPAW